MIIALTGYFQLYVADGAAPAAFHQLNYRLQHRKGIVMAAKHRRRRLGLDCDGTMLYLMLHFPS